MFREHKYSYTSVRSIAFLRADWLTGKLVEKSGSQSQVRKNNCTRAHTHTQNTCYSQQERCWIPDMYAAPPLPPHSICALQRSVLQHLQMKDQTCMYGSGPVKQSRIHNIIIICEGQKIVFLNHTKLFSHSNHSSEHLVFWFKRTQKTRQRKTPANEVLNGP